MEPPPRLWIRFGDFLQLTPEESRRWWTALVQSRWSRARELRQSFLLAQSCPWIDVQHWANTTCSNQNIIAVCEELVQEGKLSRQHTNGLEEKVLALIVPVPATMQERGRSA